MGREIKFIMVASNEDPILNSLEEVIINTGYNVSIKVLTEAAESYLMLKYTEGTLDFSAIKFFFIYRGHLNHCFLSNYSTVLDAYLESKL